MGNEPKQETSFLTIYDAFLCKVTDDMLAGTEDTEGLFIQFTEEDTYLMLQDLLINSIPRFEFPRFDLYDYELGVWGYLGEYTGVESNNETVSVYGWDGGYYNAKLTDEEINILALNMVIEWLGQQLTTTRNTQMMYSGSDFKITSQANHMAKLKVIIDAYKQDSIHMQRVYKRRKRSAIGSIQSTMGTIMEKPSYGYKIQ